ncbi:AAA family ATPase [Cutibacterium acnes]|uniref:AAA family ATPase n=1 Tax=Cutibacterium acnes TaxID=1747 RepID=UPI0020CC9627|nr:AAA family ATPase [Cutibacterium acnes]MCP9432772.1 AAA family ATPase [Cutibacterium acnes]
MKLHRIHVENFKAIDERTLELPDCGVVIATGRNEIGKTSMVEALDLLLDTSTKASSKSRKVRIAQPYGTSLQVVIEAEMTIGDHRFVHRKCFLKDKESSLKFLAGPRAGQTITGDEAVEMMETLLSGTDMTLWNALRLMQASGLSPLRLDSSQALTAALEQAGGQQPDEGSGGGLMDRARAEYDKYFTPGGSERRNVFADRDELEEIRSNLAKGQERLAEVDEVVDSLSRINEQISHDQTVVASKKTDCQKAEAALASLTELEKEVETTKRTAKEAAQRHAEAKRAHDMRAKLIDDLATAQDKYEHCQRVAAELSELGRSVAEEREEAKTAFDEAQRKVTQAEEAETQARQALTTARVGEESTKARQQLDRINELKTRITAEQQRLDTEKVTGKALSALREAVKADDLARDKALMASPQLAIEHLADGVSLRIDGADLDVPIGTTNQRRVHGELVMEMGEAWRVRISPTSEVMTLGNDAEKAHQTVVSQLEDLGVASLEQAESRLAERRVMETHISSWREHLEEEQGEVTIQELEAMAERTTETVSITAAEAQKLEEEAVAAANEARTAQRQADNRLRTVEERHVEAHEKVFRANIDAEKTAETVTRLSTELTAARKITSDEALTETLTTAQEQARLTQAEADRAQAALAERNPEQVHTEAEGTRVALTTARDRLENNIRRRAELNGQLQGLGRQQRQTEVDSLTIKEHQLARRVTGLEQRARSAKLLYQTLAAHLEHVRQSYVAPFTTQIDRIGRGVFGQELHVEIDSTLSVVARQLNGSRLEWDQLSSGAREQLGLIVRLAAARLIDPDDGVPVILDDALVYSDPVRVRHVLAEIAQSAQTSQIVVFTSAPERYDSVPGAQRVDFE